MQTHILLINGYKEHRLYSSCPHNTASTSISIDYRQIHHHFIQEINNRSKLFCICHFWRAFDNCQLDPRIYCCQLNLHVLSNILYMTFGQCIVWVKYDLGQRVLVKEKIYKFVCQIELNKSWILLYYWAKPGDTEKPFSSFEYKRVRSSSTSKCAHHDKPLKSEHADWSIKN